MRVKILPFNNLEKTENNIRERHLTFSQEFLISIIFFSSLLTLHDKIAYYITFQKLDVRIK